MSKEIKLTRGLISIIDDEDFDKVNLYKWYAAKNGNTCYAATGITINKKQKTLLMHRYILGCEDKKDLIDHIDMNGLNNQKNNIRISNKYQNSSNRNKTALNKSGYKGVCWDKRSNRWRAQLVVKQQKIYLGTYYCLIKAAKAYNEAAIKYHGEFAKLNKI